MAAPVDRLEQEETDGTHPPSSSGSVEELAGQGGDSLWESMGIPLANCGLLAYIGPTNYPKDRAMPIRISSLTKRIAANGAMLHQARMGRIHAQAADHEPSEAEQALAEERRLLKEERARRQARAQQPGPTALDKLVRTHHAEVKEKPKATKDAKEPKNAKAGKPHGPTRAEKHAAKASALDAARRATKKSAKP